MLRHHTQCQLLYCWPPPSAALPFQLLSPQGVVVAAGRKLLFWWWGHGQVQSCLCGALHNAFDHMPGWSILNNGTQSRSWICAIAVRVVLALLPTVAQCCSVLEQRCPAALPSSWVAPSSCLSAVAGRSTAPAEYSLDRHVNPVSLALSIQ